MYDRRFQCILKTKRHFVVLSKTAEKILLNILATAVYLAGDYHSLRGQMFYGKQRHRLGLKQKS